MVQLLGDKAIDKYVRLKTETTHGIGSRERLGSENMTFVAGKYSPHTSDLASTCETESKPSCWL